MLEALIDAGMDVARLNMSHGNHEEHRENIQRIRAISEGKQKPVAILMDLAGPKLRLGTLSEPVYLKIGDEVTLTIEDVVGAGDVLPVAYQYLVDELSVGDHCSLADGVVGLKVVEKLERKLRAQVLSAGQVRTRQGIHLPTGANSVAVIAEKDEADLRLGIEMGVDWVALSFVRSAADAERARAILREAGATIPLIAKIERRHAVKEIDAILEAFDGIMVARGDLGVEVPLEEVPGIQKEIIRKANLAAKPVITATQMLLSMVSSPIPTRAEVNDVANAILDGTDAVMLSEETARGEYPAQAVATMGRIARAAARIHPPEAPPYWDLPLATNNAIARASRKVAELVAATLIVTPTSTGGTARLLAMCNPTVPILALSNDPSTVRRLCLSRGVIPRLIAQSFESADQMFSLCLEEARGSGLVKKGDRIVVTAGFPLDTPGTTNLLQIIAI